MSVKPPPLGTATGGRQRYEIDPADARKAMVTVACHRLGESLDEEKADIRAILEMLGVVEPTAKIRRPAPGTGPARTRRHFPRQAEALHEDGTSCPHTTGIGGDPREQGCPGRDRFRATCHCGWSAEDRVKRHVNRLRGEHTRETTSTHAAAGAGDD